MTRRSIAQVTRNRVVADPGGAPMPIEVGDSTWYAWLDAPGTRSFTYEGKLTVRREARHGCWYWYAYRARRGKLSKVYLGKSENLSPQRLEAALARLTSLQTSGISAPPEMPVQRSMQSFTQQHPLLLCNKLVPPPAPEHLVERPRLLQRLEVGATKTLTLLCAPAGFGKTTLARSWAVQCKHAVAWLSLEHEENEPQRFLAYLDAMLRQARPGLVNISIDTSMNLTEALTTLLNALATQPDEITFLFDDYQSIENRAIHDALLFLLEHLPPHMHLLIASRGDLPVPLARLRAAGRVMELDASALRFTHDEAEKLLTHMGLRLEPMMLATLEARTEGWIAALRLACSAMQEARDPAQVMATISGRQRTFLTYLLEEVYEPQPEPVRAWLYALAVLGEGNGTLCGVVLEQLDADAMLERLERAHLLLFPSSQRPGWYRLHPLLAEALSHHLEQTRPAQATLLHTRASRWFEAQGLDEQAIEHSLAARDYTRVVALVERVASPLLMQGEVTTLHAWLVALPEALVRASPRLCIAHAWIVFITSQPDPFLGWVESAERAFASLEEPLSGSESAELHGEIVGLRAIHSVSFYDCASAVMACTQALQELPPGNLYPRALLLLLLGFAHARGTDVREGARATARASKLFQATEHAIFQPYAIMSQAEIYLAQGYPAQAARLYRQIFALANAQNVPALFSAGLAHAGLSLVMWEWNNLEAAHSHLLQAWDLGKQTQTSQTLLGSALLLALTSHAQGKTREASTWMQQVELLAQKSGRTEVVELAATACALQALREGRVEDALLWMHERHYSLEDALDVRGDFEYFVHARVLIAASRAYADVAYARRASMLLTRLGNAAAAAGKVRSQIEALSLLALARHIEGKPADALDVLGQAVALAEPGRYLRVFVDEGEPMTRLLQQLLEQQRVQKAHGQSTSLTYLSRLLKVCLSPTTPPLTMSPNLGEPLLDPLSWREREVLRLLATGRKNREIADELVVVTGTIKTHINAIYQKLGVNSRVQAVVRARNLGLL